ncbi:MAG TPA: hypothetical protein PL195_05185 [bacterium]|jgi:hypothetical protein|nr:hypothetical protein [bacterium]
MKKLIFMLIPLIMFGFSCVKDEEGENDDDKCKSKSDCPIGYECNLTTGECQQEGTLPENDEDNFIPTGDCSGHGTVTDSGCECDDGYAGANCDSCAGGYAGYPDCELENSKCAGVNCNGHGVCLEALGGCSCYTGYAGEFCTECELGYEGYPDCLLKLCDPGVIGCRGDVVVECNELGTDFIDKETCEGEGISCHKGKCLNECGIAAEDKSYVGCEYWGVFLQQGGGYEANATYALVVANPNSTDVTVEIFTSGNVPRTSGTVPAKGLFSFELGQDRRVPSAGISDLAYKLVASRPVTVTQMNPFGNVLMYSNDATILLPIGALAGEYYAMSWPGWSSLPGFVSVIAVEEGSTTVKVVYTGTSVGGSGVSVQNPGDTVSYTLNQYQVLTINSTNGGSNSYGSDLTGSFIQSDKKLAVFGGHVCTRVPADKTACDHMEHQIFPLQSWGKNFVVSRTKPRGNELDYFRILASENDTNVTWNGGLTGGVTLQAGWFHDFSTFADFRINSNKPVLVGQFLASQDAGAGTGDPAMMLIAPDEQLRKEYIFLVPPNYDYNRITIIAQKDTDIVVNGTTYSSNSFVGIMGTDYLRQWIDMPTGSHTLTANKPVGLYVYGFSSYVSYAYTAGLDLTAINIQQ